MTKLKNSNCDQIKKNLTCDKTQKNKSLTKLKKTPNVTKLKNLKYDNSKTQNRTRCG